MARDALKTRLEQRSTFTGTFERPGWKRFGVHQKVTLLLRDVRDEHGQIVTDHLWLNETKEIDRLRLRPGDVLHFRARVTSYVKGYLGPREDVEGKPVSVDYKLSRPTKVEVVSRATDEEVERRRAQWATRE